MSAPDNRAAIRRCLLAQPLFAELDDADLQALADIAFLQDLPAGRVVWDQGSQGDRYCVVVRGRLRVTRLGEDGALGDVAELRPGDAIGETSLLLGDVHDTGVSTVTPARLLIVTRADFVALLSRRPSLLRALRPREDVCQALEAPRYPWQESDERVVLVRRRHAWRLSRRLALPALLLAALLPLAYLFPHAWPALAATGLLSSAWCAWVWLDWRNDALILTTRRLVRVEKRLLFYERQQQAPLDKIQDLTVLRSGIAAALFGYGHVTVQTAGATGQLAFSHTPRPNHVKEAVFAESTRFRALQRAGRRQALEQELRRQLGLTVESPAAPEPSPQGIAVQPEGALDAAALYLTEMIQKGFPRLRQQDGDVIVWRKHWLILLGDLAWPAIVGAAFAALPFATGLEVPLPAQAAMAAVLLAWAWWQWENWRNDVYVLTPDRIMDVERVPLRLRTERREGSLGNIQNVTFVMPGILANLLNYGDVTIETAGQSGNFTFRSVWDPGEVQADIFRYVEAARQRQQQADESEQRQGLADLLATYDRLRAELGGKPAAT